MSFCINCGQQLADGAKFCSECGTPTKNDNFKRKSVYDGELHKCPNCGEILKSFVSNCPACGHEFNSTKVSSALKDFIDNINECDRLIAANPNSSKTGWASWGMGKRFWWVVLNIFTCCIPLVIYLVVPLIRYNSTPRLTPEEKRKASLIENFPFPNEREAILEALLFSKSKISYLASEKVDRKNAYWTRLWATKGEQLYQRAEMMFKGDAIANNAYKEIISQKQHVSKIVKFKAISGCIILIAVIIFIIIRNGTLDNIKASSTPLEIPETELSVLMPQIEGGKGEVNVNNSEYFAVTYYNISEPEFEKYKKDCKELGFIIDCEENGSLFYAFNEDGYNIRIIYYSSEMDITVSDNLEMRTIIWPQSDIANLLPKPESNYGIISSSSDTCMIVYIGNTTIDDYAEYVNKCIEKGFTKDMSQTDNHYHADNAEGYQVQVEYKGYNTIFIRIDD